MFRRSSRNQAPFPRHGLFDVAFHWRSCGFAASSPHNSESKTPTLIMMVYDLLDAENTAAVFLITHSTLLRPKGSFALAMPNIDDRKKLGSASVVGDSLSTAYGGDETCAMPSGLPGS